MNRIMVTGGTGYLGRIVVNRLQEKKLPVTVLSSKQQNAPNGNVEFVRGDLSSHSGLVNLLDEVDVIIHCASNPADFRNIDIEGTKNLLHAVNKNSFRHMVYISIVGIDKSSYPYYQGKLEAENLIRRSGLPHTILRTTQFHQFVVNMIQSIIAEQTAEDGLEIPSGLRFQSVDADEVAEQLVNAVSAEPKELLPDFGGPEVMTFEQMVQEYIDVFQPGTTIHPVMTSLPKHELFRTGINLCPSNAFGKITWERFIQMTDSM